MKQLFLAVLLGSMILLPSPDVRGQSGWTEEEVVLHTATGDLFGTLTLPDSLSRPDVVLIIAGSGPTDRNCNSQAGVHSNAYLMLAHGLGAEGIATLRYDKRGVYKSMAAAPKEADLRFTTYSDDAAGWVSWIREQDRFGKIIIAGHSEGSLLGMLAAQESHADAYISIAGAGENIGIILKKQLANLPEQTYGEACEAIDSLAAGQLVKKVNPALFGLLRPSVQPYMISWLELEPTEEIAKLAMPILIIQGTTDIQVETANAGLLHQAAPEAKEVLIEGMNHILKEAPADPSANRATYVKPDLPLHPDLLPAITNFIRSLHPSEQPKSL